MKKLLLIFAAAVFVAFTVSSCTKECYCTVSSNDEVLPGYEHQLVGTMAEKDCTAFGDTEWDRLNYTYTCTAE